MQVKQRLQLNAALSFVGLAAVLLVLLFVMYHINQVAETAEIADGIITGAFERATLRNDYMHNGSERAKIQWFSKNREIGRLLAQAAEKFHYPADKQIIAKMITDHESIDRIFANIVKNREKAKYPARMDALAKDTEEHLLTQLNMRIYEVVRHARELQEASGENLFSAFRLGGWGIVGLLILIMAAVAGNSWILDRIITKHVGLLHDGAEKIGNGNLDYRIDIRGEDELAQLAAAFNAMTQKLQRAYSDLGKEIAERRIAETELRESRKLLEIANKNDDLNSLLADFVGEIKTFTGCEAVGIRLLDKEGNIPYLAYEGFSRQFYEKESPLSLKTDHCMCINVVLGTTDPALPFYTAGGSFYMNGTTKFLSTVSEEEKGSTRNACNKTGYESVALIPICVGQSILGLVHLADRKDNMVPLETVKIIEQAAQALGVGVQRALAEEELRRQREQFKVTLASIGDAVIATDAAGRITFINPVAESLTGWRRKETLGDHVQGIFRIINEESREPGEDIVARVLKDGGVITLANHTSLITRDKREIPIEDSAAPIKNREGNVVGAVLVFHDVTEKRRTREALRKSEKRYRTLFATMTEGFALHEIICDEKGRPSNYRFLDVNPAFERQTGLRAADIVGRTLYEVLPQSENIWVERYGAVALTGQPAHFDHWNGVLGRHYEVSAFQTDSGQFGVTFLDVTERKRSEQALAKHTAELEAVNRELQNYSYSVSHDLRAPLRAIEGYCRMILTKQGDRFDEETKRLFQVIRENTRSIEKLIADLLVFSRLGRQRISPVIVNMEDLIKDLWQERIEANPGREFVCTIGTLPVARADRALIRQAMENLLDNAVKFTRGRKMAAIEVACHVLNIGTVYSVRDNGIGFDMKFYDKLFGVFQRLPNAEGYEGTGMGLAQVQRIIHKHGGQIWAESKVDKGATFYFTLPGE